MKIRTALVAAILAAAPTLALAGGGCNWGSHSEQAMSCADGLTWDEKTGTCVEIVSG